jgi:hypothetical protein
MGVKLLTGGGCGFLPPSHNQVFHLLPSLRVGVPIQAMTSHVTVMRRSQAMRWGRAHTKTCASDDGCEFVFGFLHFLDGSTS